MTICPFKKNSVLFFTDLHLSDTTLGICDSVFNQLVSVYKGFDKDTKVVFGGDLFNSRRAQSHGVLLFFKEWLQKIRHTFGWGNFFFLAGNHDKIDTSSEESWLDLFLGRGVNAIHSFGSGSELQFVCLDFFDRDEYVVRLSALRERLGSDIGKTVLFTHIGIDEMRPYKGTENQHSSEATKDMFEGFHKVISGHYHNHSEHDNIYYAGSAYQANFGEDDNKGFLVLTDVEGKLKIERLPTEYKKYITYRCVSFDIGEFSSQYKDYGSAAYRVVSEEEPSEEAIHFLKENGIMLQYKEDRVVIEGLSDDDINSNDYGSLLKDYLMKAKPSDNEYNRRLEEDFKLKIKQCCVGE